MKWNPVREFWLPMAFQDPAFLHALIFCSDGFGAIATGVKERPASVIHLRHAIRIVNERLSAPVPIITDTTIVVVCSLAHTEVCGLGLLKVKLLILCFRN